jgi:DNA-binding HxlR family transcriptional regulator
MKAIAKTQNNCNRYESCPVTTTLNVIGGKWKPIILWEMERGVLRFGELKRTIAGITQKMLTQQLRELEEDGIIWRKVYAEVPPRVEYGITDYGQTLRVLLNEMAQWGMRHLRCKEQRTVSEL